MAAREWPARHRFIVNTPLHVGETCALDSRARQLGTVLRLVAGDAIVLVNGDGCEYLATLQALTSRHAAAAVVDRRAVQTDPQVHLALYQCTLKHDKFEWVLQKGAELGVSTFVPVVSRRSVVRPAAALQGKLPRWSAIVLEATEQCGRTRPPVLAQPLDWTALTLPTGVCGFVAWEEADAAPSLGDAVAEALAGCKQSLPALALLVGPEGGLTVEEVNELREAGWCAVTLGPRTLRAETAAIAGATIVMERCGELGRPRA